MGMLIDGLERRQHQAREEFADRYAGFSTRDHQDWFRQLFASSNEQYTHNGIHLNAKGYKRLAGIIARPRIRWGSEVLFLLVVVMGLFYGRGELVSTCRNTTTTVQREDFLHARDIRAAGHVTQGSRQTFEVRTCPSSRFVGRHRCRMACLCSPRGPPRLLVWSSLHRTGSAPGREQSSCPRLV